MASFPTEGWLCQTDRAGFQISTKCASDDQDVTVRVRGDGKVAIVGSDEKPGEAQASADAARPAARTSSKTPGNSRQSTGKVTGKWTWLQGRGRGEHVMYLYVALRHSSTGTLLELQRPTLDSILMKENAKSNLLQFDKEIKKWIPCATTWKAPNLFFELEKGMGTVFALNAQQTSNAESPERHLTLSSDVHAQSTSLKGGNIRKLKSKQHKDFDVTLTVSLSTESELSQYPSDHDETEQGANQGATRTRSADMRQEEAETILFAQAGVHDPQMASLHQAHWKLRHVELQAGGSIIYFQEMRSAEGPRGKDLERVVLCELGEGACVGVETCQFQGSLAYGLILRFDEGKHAVAQQHLAFATAGERSIWIETLLPYTRQDHVLPDLPRTRSSSHAASRFADRPTVNKWAKTKWFAHYVDDADPTEKTNLRRQIRRGDLKAPRTFSSLDFHTDMTARALGHKGARKLQDRMVRRDGSPMDLRASSVMDMSPGAFGHSHGVGLKESAAIFERAAPPANEQPGSPTKGNSPSPAREGRTAVLPAIIRAGRRLSVQSAEAGADDADPGAGSPKRDEKGIEGKFEDRCFTLLREIGLVRKRAKKLRHSVDPDSSDSDDEDAKPKTEVRDMSKALLASPMFGYVYRRPLTADSEDVEEKEDLHKIKEELMEIVSLDNRGGLSAWLDDKVAKQQKRKHRHEERLARKEAAKQGGKGGAAKDAESPSEGELRAIAEAVNEEEANEVKAQEVVSHFPSTWIRDAVEQMGESAWKQMRWSERLRAVQALLLDANNLDQMLTDMTWRRDPLANTVQIREKRMVELIYEVSELCVRARDTRQVLALLNSIEDADDRQKIGVAISELASHCCLYDMVEALKEAGFEWVGLTNRRKLRTPGAIEEPALPEKAQQLLQDRDARRLALQQPRPRFMSAAADLALEDGEEQIDRFEDLLDYEWADGGSRGTSRAGDRGSGAGDSRGGSRGGGSRGGSQASPSEGGHSAGGKGGSHPGSRAASHRGGSMKNLAAGSESGEQSQHDEDEDGENQYGLSHETASQIRKMIRDGKALAEIQAEVKMPEGGDIDMDILMEMKEDWAGNLLKDFPIDHPIKIFCAKLMTLSVEIYMGKWRLWHIGRRRKRDRIQQQYLSMCDHHHLTPVGVQSIHRYMLSRQASSLNLSGQGISKLAINCLLEALTGTGEALTGDALDMCNLRHKFHDEPLTSLDLSGNDIQSEGAGLLADVLVRRGWKVKDLNLDGNSLREHGPMKLSPLLVQPEEKKNAYELVKLSLAKNGIGDRGVEKLAKLLCDNKHLRWLNLAGNSAGLYAGKALGEMVQHNNTLNYLDLSFNMLRTEGAVAFADGVAQNNHLEEVILAWNGFGDTGPCAALGRAMETFFVKTLDIGYNRINKQGAVVLAGHLEKNSGIHRVVLDGNLISQGGARALFKAAKVASEGEDFAPEVSVKDCGIGIVDQQAFDPSEPSGEYDLDMKDMFSRGVLVNLFRNFAAGKGHFVPLPGKPEFNAMLDDKPFQIELPTYSYTDQDGKAVSIINPDETEWVLPLDGILVFRYASIRVRDLSADTLDSSSFNKLLRTFKDTEQSHAARKEVMNMYLHNDTVVHFTQVAALVEALSDKAHTENKDLRQTRAEIVAMCFHKLIEGHRSRELLTLLDPESRKASERILGPSSFDFTRNNPTGYYNLNLAEAGDREICMMLLEIRSQQIPRIKQLQKYYVGRTGGPRDDLERVWRNVKFNGKPVPFDPAWRVPNSGTVELDFVQIVRPGSTSKPMENGEFDDFLERVLYPLAEAAEEGEYVAKVRNKSDEAYFTCEQVYRMLYKLTKPNLRVEMCVVGFARVVDWHAYKMLEVALSSTEQKQLRDRIGSTNLWDETMAVGFYELDLGDREQRFVAQEVVHLGHVEPGENMGECTYNDSDFDIPAGWVKDIPRQGLLQLYYIRDGDVVKQVRLQGAYDQAESPMMTDHLGEWYGDELFGMFAPSWIRDYRWHDGSELHEAVGDEWIKEHKLRRIQKKLEEKFQTCEEALSKLDKDGSGEMSRAEIAIGLFHLGIWLRPSEMEALMSVLDEDDGGEVDAHEFKQFWERYSGKDDVDRFEIARAERARNTPSRGGGRGTRKASCLRRGSVAGYNTLGLHVRSAGPRSPPPTKLLQKLMEEGNEED